MYILDFQTIEHEAPTSVLVSSVKLISFDSPKPLIIRGILDEDIVFRTRIQCLEGAVVVATVVVDETVGHW